MNLWIELIDLSNSLITFYYFHLTFIAFSSLLYFIFIKTELVFNHCFDLRFMEEDDMFTTHELAEICGSKTEVYYMLSTER